ncbi:ATP-binding protein [Streptomyces sp. NPDC093111]|uniref:ATP-binding protein n=1 Tax=Streptomyces sp. NPDC093111 TaxID=3154978 RepID=UPI00342BBB5C
MKVHDAVSVTGRQDTPWDCGDPVRTPAQARRLVRRALGVPGPATLPGPGADPLLDDLLLVVSELVTNAQRHAGGVTGFALDVGPDGATVGVSDASRQAPRCVPGGGLRTGGFGWPIVLRLCREVTVDVRPDGKTVTAVVPVTDRRG